MKTLSSSWLLTLLLVFPASSASAEGRKPLHARVSGLIEFAPQPPAPCFAQLTIPVVDKEGESVGTWQTCLVEARTTARLVDGAQAPIGRVDVFRGSAILAVPAGTIEVSFTLQDVVTIGPTSSVGTQQWTGTITGGTGKYRRAQGRVFGVGSFSFDLANRVFTSDIDLAFLFDRRARNEGTDKDDDDDDDDRDTKPKGQESAE